MAKKTTDDGPLIRDAGDRERVPMTTTPKPRPILFSAPMVRAILADAKTQTRRIVTPQPVPFEEEPLVNPRRHAAPYVDIYNGGEHACWWTSDDRQGPGWFRCPFGRVGDLLWVKEAWCPLDRGHYHDSGPRDRLTTRFGPPRRNGAAYRADMPTTAGAFEDSERCRVELGYRWRSAATMPRWASRLTLRVTGVRVQRLQEISEADAIAEGAQSPGVPASLTNVGAFAKLWESIHGQGAWSLNPWVWAITFTREEQGHAE
jgi:hypothetical protein